jgi:hypothetical protein
MHRHLLRLQLPPPFTILLFVVAALALSAGCGFVYPPPGIPEAVQKEMFHVGDPIALLSFEPGRMSGKILGELHGWPFPHLEGNEGTPTSNFTYVGQFNVTAKSDDDGMPAGAEGTRKIFFHGDAAQLNFADPRGYATGQEVALDSLSMTFSFRENHKIVAVRMISQQKSARAFVYKGRRIEPPKDRDTADTLQGDYSADLGGYVLRSLNE